MMFHYCCHHSEVKILAMRRPVVIPPRMIVDDGRWDRTPERKLLGSLSWFTDLESPYGNALGLKQIQSTCDRTEVRLLVEEEDEDLLTPWWRFRRARPEWARLGGMLERAEGVMPMHWYVATEPVRVVAP